MYDSTCEHCGYWEADPTPDDDIGRCTEPNVKARGYARTTYYTSCPKGKQKNVQVIDRIKGLERRVEFIMRALAASCNDIDLKYKMKKELGAK